MYRMAWPSLALQSQGHTDIVVSYTDEAAVSSELRADEFDVVVIQRPLRDQMHEHVKAMQAAGVAVVVDIDDDFSCIPPANVNYNYFHPKYSPQSNFNYLNATCRIADLVTVTTPALARRYGGHGRVAILPNYVPEWYLKIEPTPSYRLTMGWSGTIETHPHDLESTVFSVGQVVRETNIGFRVIGTGTGVQERLGLRDKPEVTGWVDIQGPYQLEMAKLDLGIVPLHSCAFNDAKSWLKGLEFAAVGTPFVASDTPEYQSLAALGAGMIARSKRDWVKKLRLLIEDEAIRTRLAKESKEAAAQLTIEKNCWKWLEAWEGAKKRRGKLHKAVMS